MASMRQRVWITRQGKRREAWLVDWFDRERVRHIKQFADPRKAETWLHRIESGGEVWRPPEERESEYPPMIEQLEVGNLGLRLNQALDRIERLLNRIDAT
jgi:hypothetical protein